MCLTRTVRLMHIGVMKLGDYRLERKMSATALGRALGVSHSTILRLEQHQIAPSRQLVAKIQRLTHSRVTANDLFPAAPPMVEEIEAATDRPATSDDFRSGDVAI